MPDLQVAHVENLPRTGTDRWATVVPRHGTLEGFALESEDAEGVAIESLEAGTTVLVQTLHSHYRFVVLDGPKHLVVVKGGAMFPEATPVRLEGATAGGSALKMGWIIAGLKIDMLLGRRRIRSSRVCSVAIEGIPSACHSHSLVA